MINLPDTDYETVHEFSGKIAGQSIAFISKPGLPDWKHISPSASLLAEAILPRWDNKILNIVCGHGALAAVLGKRVAEHHLVVMDSDQIALNCTQKTLQVNGIRSFELPSAITLLPHSAHTFSIVALDIPKGRKLTRHWLVESYHLLEPEGSLYLAGANDQGIQPAIKDAQELFGNAVIIDYKKGNRCALVKKESERSDFPEWAHTPGIAPGTWVSFEVSLREIRFTIQSMPGIFSYDRLDEGSSLLLETIMIPDHSNILDVGCGYGIIGLYAASHAPSSMVDMLDSNRLAVAATAENLTVNQIKNAKVYSSDLLECIQDKHYHQIISNPPFHTGKEVNYAVAASLLRQSFQALLPGGQLVLVANRFIRYDHLMKDIFGNAHLLAQTRRFHILSAMK